MKALIRLGRYKTALGLFVASLCVKYGLIFALSGSSLTPLKGSYQHLVAARNLHYHDRFAVESSRNVVLASDQVLANAHPSVLPNRFIAVLYGYVFDVFGFHPSLPIHVSVVASSLSITVLYFVVARTFSDRVAAVFAILSLLSSIVLYEALWIGVYEFGLLLFAITLLLVFRPTETASDQQYSLSTVAVIGGCMGLTFLSRNAFAFSFVPLTLYVYVRVACGKEPPLRINSPDSLATRLSVLVDRRAVATFTIICISFALVVAGGVALTTATGHSTESRYASDYVGDDSSSDERFRNVAGYGHLYPDPYTYHFDRTSYLKSVSDTGDPDKIAFLKQYGYETSADQDRTLYVNSALHYTTGFFTPNAQFPPSPLVLVLLATGLSVLFARRRALAVLFVAWPVFLYIMYIALWTSNWDHYLEVLFPVLAMQSVGFVYLYDQVSAWLTETRLDGSLLTDQRVLTVLAVGLLVVHSVGTAGVHLYNPLTSNGGGQTVATAERIDDHLANDSGVVAYSSSNGYDINYYANVSVVRFVPGTVVGLLNNQSLGTAFDRFDVTAVAGYNRTVSCRIQDQTNATVVETYSCYALV